MQYRLVGPFRGGRVVAVSGVVGQDNVYYFGAVAGGVWKSTDAGLNWKPIFDKTKDASPSIGAPCVLAAARAAASWISAYRAGAGRGAVRVSSTPRSWACATRVPR